MHTAPRLRESAHLSNPGTSDSNGLARAPYSPSADFTDGAQLQMASRRASSRPPGPAQTLDLPTKTARSR